MKEYTPILKGKRGEFTALQHLGRHAIDRTFPIIEIPPIPTRYDEKEVGVPVGPIRTFDEHVEMFVRNCQKIQTDFEFGIDFSHISANPRVFGKSTVDYVFTKCYEAGLTAVPVLGLNEEFDHEANLIEQISDKNIGAVVRIHREDCRFPTAINNKLQILAQTAKRSLNELSVVFDFGQITRGDIEEVIAECEQLETELPIHEFKSASIVATSMPDSATLGMKAFTTDSIPRLEWQLWKRLNASTLAFGDYGVTNPAYLDIDFRLITLGGKIRYTTSDCWVIVKGMKLKDNGDQFHKLARILESKKVCENSQYSWGDRRIRECAANKSRSGSLETWLAITTNHHVTLVSRQLATAA
ncbi:MAG: beta family protein [Planctomycetaceae bacterium]|nr:beta family protein [Planctomycetales bacterium]MCB9920891.1 beta family protein [Planctomycetaceae bacterium]